ncbi:Cell division protein ZapA, inhibits GTPase activity of FtsZ [Cyclonatronum proteinivorum]|uniref:Cell division protein ZapA, inhibits GTPase activity of FtsZ n=1 Tax=Cyclonatronum proteinivorum TaxID=1457365 RepID=A0A345UKK9_9BACT|nr:cell division protein ZapA [Cyclonatronum proteinivorum]AXJ01011.1 Cell division protein ZapA, inhibits GTPase activity of FtsZ [Cyclonatronum proteinivorum]
MKSIKVTILNKQYPLKVQPGDELLMEEVAQFVDRRLKDMKKHFAGQPNDTIMVLSCLSLAEEIFLLKKNMPDSFDKDLNNVLFGEVAESLQESLNQINTTKIKKK